MKPVQLVFLASLGLCMGGLCFAGLCGRAAAGPPPAAVHADSLSRSRLVVEGRQVQLELRCQELSVLEVLEADTDGSGWLDDAELAAMREPLAAYVAARYRLTVDSGGEPGAGRALTGRLESLSRYTQVEGVLFPEPWVVMDWVFEDTAPITDLSVEMRLFFETSPGHRDLCSLNWHGVEQQPALFSVYQPGGRFAAPLPGSSAPDSGPATGPAAGKGAGEADDRPDGSLVGFVGLGVHHILSGWDHLAFVLALVVTARGVASLVGVITAFTVAHSITLALAALGHVSLPSRPVEATIALSICVVGLDNLRAGAPRHRVALAFVFGLVHGLGFAGVLTGLVSDPALRVRALIGFNLGVELGQLGVVVLLALLFAALSRLGRPATGAEEASPGLTSPGLARVVSVGVTLAGGFWFVQRLWPTG